MTKPVKIVMVEDEEDLIEVVAFNLEADGYEIISTPTGENAVSLIRKAQPDLVLLDIMLPGKDGFSICKQVKTDVQLKRIPIIMVTAKNSEEDVVRGLELGADDYVTKPFSMKILNARIKNVLKRADDTHRETRLQFHALTIDTLQYAATLAEEPLKLTTAEFHALHLFASRPGRVFTRNQIIDSVRGEDHIVTDRTIDVLIVGLRKKLQHYAHHIETIRGVGYRFNPEPPEAKA